ncbi:cyclic nucleotide-binding domain-containing protein 2 isoform X2 [Pyxicephalus adspersus]
MTFDPTLFKRRQDRFPEKAKLITLKKPDWRTDRDIKYLCSLLQTLRSFQHYSSNLQMLLAKILRFERFRRRRVIIKKGHVGSSFYFIYSGSVAVCSDEDGSSAFLDQEPTLLHKGDKFGDIALIKSRRRNATVVCMSETELLVVDKKDFFANKLDEQLHKEFNNRFDYFRSLDIFSHWPIEHIINVSENCQAKKFYYGQMIIQDSWESNSIAFITEGTCEVLRLVKLNKCPSYHTWLCASLPFQYTSVPQQLRQTTGKHPKCHHLLEHSSSQQQCYSGTANPYAQKLAALKEIVEVCCPKKKSLENTAEISHLKAQHDEDVAVLLQIDILHKRDFLGLHEILLQDDQKDKRNLMMVSKGCNVILLKMEKFYEFCDPATIEKLQKYQKAYPSDDILCKFFLQQNDWKMFKRDLVNSLVKPLTIPQAEKKKTREHFQPPPNPSQCSTITEKQETSKTSAPKGIDVSTQERRQNPSNRNVRLVDKIVVPRRKPDRIYK